MLNTVYKYDHKFYPAYLMAFAITLGFVGAFTLIEDKNLIGPVSYILIIFMWTIIFKENLFNNL